MKNISKKINKKFPKPSISTHADTFREIYDEINIISIVGQTYLEINEKNITIWELSGLVR